MISITQNENKMFVKYIGGLIYNSENINFYYKQQDSEFVKLEMNKIENNEYIIELNDIEGEISYYFENEKGELDNNFEMNYYYESECKPEANIVVIEEKSIDKKRKKLRKTYIWSKKIKLAVYKLIISLPRFITGNYRRRINL